MYWEEVKFIQCPYNASHCVKRYRFPFHIAKCKKGYPDVKLEHCPFNYTHMLDSAELSNHVRHCPQRDRSKMNEYKNLFFGRGEINNIDSDESSEDECYYVGEPTRKPPVVEADDLKQCYTSASLSLSSSSEWKKLDSKESVTCNILEPLRLPKTISKAFSIRS